MSPELAPQRAPTARPRLCWRPLFLAAMRNTGNIRASCEAAGVSRVAVWKARQRSEVFRKQWEEALEEACDVLEVEARRRALSQSDFLLWKLLVAHRPKVYREATTAAMAQAVAQTNVYVGRSDDDPDRVAVILGILAEAGVLEHRGGNGAKDDPILPAPPVA